MGEEKSLGNVASKFEKEARNFEVLRQDFPAIKNLQAYLDTAYVGLMPESVRAAHESFLEERAQFGSLAVESTILGTWLQRLSEVRKKMASFLGARAKEIAFSYCTGCGANVALNGIDWHPKDNAVIDDLEYPTDVHILNSLKRKGVEIRIAKNENGAVPVKAFEALVDGRTRALVVSHVSYLNGFRHNLKALADLIHHRRGYLLVDGTQSVGCVKVDVKDENVDIFTAAPYKWLLGPPGVGFFYIREDLIPLFYPDRLGWASTENFTLRETMESGPLPDHARRYEYGTLNFEGIYALDAALDYIDAIGIKRIEEHNLTLTRMLRDRLSEQGVKFFSPEGTKSSILTFFVDDEKDVWRKLREREIFITARRWKGGQIRVSPHFYNNEEDIGTFVDAVAAMLHC